MQERNLGRNHTNLDARLVLKKVISEEWPTIKLASHRVASIANCVNNLMVVVFCM